MLALRTIQERVARGAKLLDRKYSGWAKHINVQTLSISDGRGCILGQLYGDYSNGVCAVIPVNCKNGTGFKKYNGFTPNCDDGKTPVNFATTLNGLWIKQIKKRLRQSASLHIAS